MPGKFTLGKNQRLKSRKSIEGLFSEGKTITSGSCKAFYRSSENNLQFAAGVSSKNFKKAVERNRVKRLLRESWRLQKNPLELTLKNSGRGLEVFILFTGKELPEYKDIYTQTGLVITKLMKINN